VSATVPSISRWKRVLVTVLCLVATAWVLPRRLVGRHADALFDGDRAAQQGLADAVSATVLRDVGPRSFRTGSPRFDGEWALTSNQFAALGMAQVVAAHPALRSRYLPALHRAAEALLRPETRQFAHSAWGRDPLEHLDAADGNAWLGYLALGLGAVREVDPSMAQAGLHDRIVDALARRLAQSPTGLVETYPGEVYPCDMAAMLGAIGQHARLTGRDRAGVVARGIDLFRTRFRDPASGYLVQSLDPRSGRVVDGPRGSGTALSAYFLSFADPGFARTLGGSLRTTGHAEIAGFAAVREYPRGGSGRGDIDSGPVLLGVSVSATGFALGAARQRGDRGQYRALYRTAALFGVPVDHGAGWRFVTGGPLGNALLLAMLTARPP